jgi:hypothetical protein
LLREILALVEDYKRKTHTNSVTSDGTLAPSQSIRFRLSVQRDRNCPREPGAHLRAGLQRVIALMDQTRLGAEPEKGE